MENRRKEEFRPTLPFSAPLRLDKTVTLYIPKQRTTAVNQYSPCDFGQPANLDLHATTSNIGS
ncbi:hypothetical protein [Nostoc sp.]|uniref:hypothetical protein n=1 Tax=Nostoc sp. TaxID=1180 RepID=UPI002FF80F1A